MITRTNAHLIALVLFCVASIVPLMWYAGVTP